PAAGHTDVFLLRIDALDRLIHLNPAYPPGERLREAVDTACLRINEFGVIPHSLVRQSESAVYDFFQSGFGNGPADPVGCDVVQILLPKFFVVGKHEVLRDSRTESPDHPVVKVFWTAVSRRLHAFDKADDAFLDDFGRQTERIGLKWI